MSFDYKFKFEISIVEKTKLFRYNSYLFDNDVISLVESYNVELNVKVISRTVIQGCHLFICILRFYIKSINL